MHILILTNRIPYPLKDGGSLAMHYFIEGYIEAGVKVSLLAMNTSKHYCDKIKLPAIYQQIEIFESVDIKNEINVLSAFINLFQKNKSYNIQRFEHKSFDQKLQSILQRNQFDFIQLESLFLTPYVDTIKKYSTAKVILRSHNIEYKIWEKLYLQEPKFLKKYYYKFLTKRLKQYELDHINDYDIILPISNLDKRFYELQGSAAKLYTQTFGIKISNKDLVEITAPNNPPRLYHLGAMDWRPNLESVKWLIDEIMPEIYKSHPHITLYLAGRKMPEHLLSSKIPNVNVIGEVEDALAFEKDKDILLVPLLSGGGVRIKIFQGMAIGKAVITTPVGVEGIEVSHKEHLLVADNKVEFIKYVRYLIDNPSEIQRLGKNAQDTIRGNYDRNIQIRQLIDFLKSQLN